MVETGFGYSFCTFRESDAGIKHDTKYFDVMVLSACPTSFTALHHHSRRHG